MAKLKNIHPGEVLAEEFLIPFAISAYKLAKDICIPRTRISEIIKGNRGITADTALRLGKYFVLRPSFGLVAGRLRLGGRSKCKKWFD
jgi:addiction module HigA family antidote